MVDRPALGRRPPRVSTPTHPDVRSDAVALAVVLQVPLDLLVREEAGELLIEGEVWEHHHLLGQVCPNDDDDDGETQAHQVVPPWMRA